MGTTKSREFKIEWLVTKIYTIMDVGRVVDEEKLIADFCIAFSSTPRTAREILKLLEISGKIIRKNNKIWTKDAILDEPPLKKLETYFNTD